MAIGVLVRATLISAVYKRALSLTVEARASHPNGQLTTLVSSDVSVTCHDLEIDEQISRIDYCAQCKSFFCGGIGIRLTLRVPCGRQSTRGITDF